MFVFVDSLQPCGHLLGKALNYLLAILYVMSSSGFVTFPYGVLGQLWYLFVSITGLCLRLYIDGLLLLFYLVSRSVSHQLLVVQMSRDM